MSDLDGNASSAVVKPKPIITKANIMDSSKRDAQNYFKSLYASVKKTMPTLLTTEQPTIQQDNVRCVHIFKNLYLTEFHGSFYI